MKLDKTYEEKVYAGVLGKLIGVYLGRPFEQWSHERIMEELGEINYYVNEQLNVPLVVRLAGTNFEEGKKILEDSDLKILSASDLNYAAKKIVEAIK